MTDEQTAAECLRYVKDNYMFDDMHAAIVRALQAAREDAVNLAFKVGYIKGSDSSKLPDIAPFVWVNGKRAAPPGHIIDDAGVVRLVLGTFVLTEEGCVVGNGAKVFLMSDNWRDGKYVYQVTASVDLGEPDCRKCFAEPTNAAAYLKQKIDAAEAAKEANEAKHAKATNDNCKVCRCHISGHYGPAVGCEGCGGSCGCMLTKKEVADQ